MNFYLRLCDAWLEALGPWWKRVCFFCVVLITASVLGDYFWDEDSRLESYFWTGGMFGPATYVLFGPLQLLSLITAGVVGFRFFHLQQGETLGLAYLAFLVAINTGFYRYPSNSTKDMILLHVVAIGVLAILLRLRHKSEKS